jgi:hypothetical protein
VGILDPSIPFYELNVFGDCYYDVGGDLLSKGLSATFWVSGGLMDGQTVLGVSGMRLNPYAKGDGADVL